VIFTVIGVTSTIVAYFNIDGSFARPYLAAMIFGVFWSPFTALAVWVIAAYFREGLILAPSSIIQHGIFRSRTLEVGEVLQIKWRTWPVGGTIIVRTHAEKIKIYLDNFTKDERDAVVLFFREKFADDVQENWSRFEKFTGRPSSQQKRASRGGILPIAALLMCFAGVSWKTISQ